MCDDCRPELKRLKRESNSVSATFHKSNTFPRGRTSRNSGTTSIQLKRHQSMNDERKMASSVTKETTGSYHISDVAQVSSKDLVFETKFDCCASNCVTQVASVSAQKRLAIC